ncbi:conserved hypothetical protein [Vibrio nigripulchritudo MADA3029]|uniref:Uncharacterized protein n=2 Tax=Vibrio nigripulchritudo TaxID=28173 RepID=U4K5N1_9VIBR|nr:MULTISPECIES: hypothetical protein [Vibrio]EGU61036.1 hypothetical protein VINI7043_19068 [Vibrio nigripulchritudo ATCC 27043]KJY71093.1 hypothetical protein TW74_23260 [Vibrio nigripulchritudo]UAB68873.1 hypothetical protein INR79_09965 [Vibrio sp. SCSIO 43132]CCN46761.1 conserved hypothetical protein [Vibrio nigripulchritudo MADA3020]CCN51958.1 conserved hypothetical protein [Vibrio nigripulchritudo MADA3021]
MITVEKQDALTLKITHVMPTTKMLDLDVYIFAPGELGLSADVLSENDFYYGAISEKRAYYSDKTHLPLVHSRLAKRGQLSNNQYRVSLSLYAYQYLIALDKAVDELNQQSRDSVTEEEVDDVIGIALDILKRLRRSIPYDETQKRYYANIDNYLSWYTEQHFLSLVAHLPRGKEYGAIKERLIVLCEKEVAHRELNRYNSKKARNDITRMSNKMRLLRRLIEYPIVLKKKNRSMGKNVMRAVKGIATGFVMIFVTTIAILMRDRLGEITVSFIIIMSFIYALREIFKDDLRDILWRWIRKGKPKWRGRYFDPSTNKMVGQKIEWLDYTSYSKLPDRIQKIRKRRVAQREEQVLHYRSQTEMTTTLFMSGYEQTRETLNVSLSPIARLMDKGSSKIYQLKDGQVSKESVEKRHLLNLIIKEDNHDAEPNYYRWKIVLNRSKIVDIEQITI